MIKITHNAGFFSCCSVKLNSIVDFINSNKSLPDIVDSSQQFILYKNDKNIDITFDYFENYNMVTDVNIIHPIDYDHVHKFKNYSNLDYLIILEAIILFVDVLVTIIMLFLINIINYYKGGAKNNNVNYIRV